MTPPSREDVETLARDSRWVGELARRLVGDVHLAEDVAQESFVRAIGAQSTAHSLRALLSKIVGKVAAGTRRREHVRRTRERERANAGPDPEQLSTFDIVARVEQQKILVDAVLELDEPYRRTVLQRYFEGIPQREIAQREDIPTTTVNSRLTRAIAKLRQRFDLRHGGDRRKWVTGPGVLISLDISIGGNILEYQ